MKIVILCGGLGSRLSEETKLKPKPMVKVGNMPILSHIIKIYEKFGYNEFYIALGYKGHVIKKYFSKLKTKSKFHLINTGAKTLTGGRLLRLKKYFKKDENFMLTYGDGLSGQNISKLVKFHLKNKKIATMTIVRPPVRFGEVKIHKNIIKRFKEKPQISSSWINGGFFVFNSKVFDLIKNDQTMLERKPLEKLSQKGQLCGFKHYGFWQCMDTLRDKKFLENIYKKSKKKSPWLI